MNMGHIVATTDILSAIVLAILGISMLGQRNRLRLSDNIFIVCLFSTVVTAGVDGLSYLVDGHLQSDPLLLVINFLTFSLGDIVMTSFAYYEWAIMNEKKPTSRLIADVVAIACVVDIITQIICVATHKSYYIVDGEFITGELYDLCGTLIVIVILYCLVVTLVKRKSFTQRELLSVGTYLILPILALVVEIINADLSFIYSAIMISFLIMYVGIEVSAVERVNLRAEVMMEVINKDTLTGLHNRHAYDDALAKLAGAEKLGVVFCDLNGLKYTNDNFGHAQGDTMISRFSGLLKESFGEEYAFRISGDEFVAFAPETGETEFQTQVETLRVLVARNEELAAVGSSYGAGSDLRFLLEWAESAMYQDKEAFYETHSHMRRG